MRERLTSTLGALRADALADSELRAWLPSVGALALVALSILLQGDEAPANRMVLIRAAAVITVCLRWFTPRLPTALLWLLGDAVVLSALVQLSGQWFSPYYFLVVAGIWWAAHRHMRHSGLVYAVVFSILFGWISVGTSLADARLHEVLEDVVVALVIGLLADWYVRVDRRAVALTDALAALGYVGASPAALHRDLVRATTGVVLPVDSLLAGGQVGLKMQETELLGLLMLGLTNPQLAETMHLSEATVKFRLTRLYRRLGVRGRAEAIAWARAHGLSAAGEGPPAGPVRA